MGCDIHAYIDYDEFKNKDGKWFATCFAKDVELGRNYTLFALMAGVRYDPRTDRDYAPLFEPRGLPERVSWNVNRAYCLSITDSKPLEDEEGYCSKEQAERWTREGSSVWMNDKHTLVSGPDWHSASWLSVSDLERIVDAYQNIKFPERSWFQLNPPEKQPVPDNATVTQMDARYGVEWYVEAGKPTTAEAPASLRAALEAMKCLNGDDPSRARLVFWFDN